MLEFAPFLETTDDEDEVCFNNVYHLMPMMFDGHGDFKHSELYCSMVSAVQLTVY